MPRSDQVSKTFGLFRDHHQKGLIGCNKCLHDLEVINLSHKKGAIIHRLKFNRRLMETKDHNQ